MGKVLDFNFVMPDLTLNTYITHSLSDGTNDSRIDYLFKDENYYDILKRYRSTRI